ncbi:hypothetical protein C8F01DRAFT_1266129 [Mycena amicta]|nr:hypothetical protein C8F01DRAFT_1266129 [Mycena amicta]
MAAPLPGLICFDWDSLTLIPGPDTASPIIASPVVDPFKGERYLDIDIPGLYSNSLSRRLVLSYDIVCRLPVCHVAAHQERYQAANLLSGAEGVARTDGEGIERKWRVLNASEGADSPADEPGFHRLQSHVVTDFAKGRKHVGRSIHEARVFGISGSLVKLRAMLGRRTGAAPSTFVYSSAWLNPVADLSFHFAADSSTITQVSNVAPQKRVRRDDSEDYTSAEFLALPPLDAAELAAVADTLTTLEDSSDVYEHQIEEDEVSNGKRQHYESSEWAGELWEPVALHRLHLKDDSPKSLRFCYQLGHQGHPCPLPRSPQALVVIDTSGVFTLDIQLCGCSKSLRQDHIAQLMANEWYPATVSEMGTCATFRALDLFRLLNVVGNISAHDFVGTLERLTDPTLLGKTPDRYRAFTEGWNPDAEGVGPDAVKPGALAVECWACPRPGFNLPVGWENCDPDDEFLYGLMLALDANFRLKNRLRANERHDPSLGSGWSYFVDDEPYKEHLRDYVAEEDVSTCIAFAALMQRIRV